MPTQIPADVAAAIQNMVDRGYFHTTDEALQAGVKLLMEHDRYLEGLRNTIAETDVQLEGEVGEQFGQGGNPIPDVHH